MKRFLSVVLLVIVLYSITPSLNRRTTRREYHKYCYNNQRVLMGAIEMYNMDHTELITFYDDDDDAIQKLLVEGGYLKCKICNPTSHICNPTSRCHLGSIGDLTRGGRITCKLHGDPEHPTEKFKEQASFGKMVGRCLEWIFGGS